MPDAGEPTSAPLEQWLTAHRATGDTLLVGVSTGAEVLASPACSTATVDHPLARMNWFDVRYPNVSWQHGARYLDDGDLIDDRRRAVGSRRRAGVRRRFLERTRRSRRPGRWAGRGYSPGSAAAVTPQLAWRRVVARNGGYRSDRARMGMLLTDGVGETELASAFRPYTTFSYVARPLAVTVDGAPSGPGTA